MKRFIQHITQFIPIEPLVTFRILFGLLGAFSGLRYWYNGWIQTQLIQPSFHFTYSGFDWISPLQGNGMYLIFGVLILSALFISVGLFYRIAAVLYFLTFTYIELIDKTYYLNHYYLVSILAAILIFLPANKKYSLDLLVFKFKRADLIPAWTIWVILFQLCIVYFYAGLSKLNSEWLLEALPLKIWLPARVDTFLIGPLLDHPITAYFFSWFGAFFDLLIPFLLLSKTTRKYAFFLVIVFHLATSLLFNIGIFPYMMILSNFIFFSAKWHQKLYQKFAPNSSSQTQLRPIQRQKWMLRIFLIHFILQLLIPFRFLLYSGDLYWKEQGFRFSWRVMIIEKFSDLTFFVEQNGNRQIVSLDKHLNSDQIYQMQTQPDMILQFAHNIGETTLLQTSRSCKVFVECYTSLNGRSSQLFINPKIDLLSIEDGFYSKNWVLPLQSETEF